MRIVYYLILLFSFGCSSSPSLCDEDLEYDKIIIETEKYKCGIKKLEVRDEDLIDSIMSSICNSEPYFMLSKQGDLRNIHITFLPSNSSITITQTMSNTYYIRNERSVYYNDSLVSMINKIMKIDCPIDDFYLEN